jgi:hypothetical protein
MIGLIAAESVIARLLWCPILLGPLSCNREALSEQDLRSAKAISIGVGLALGAQLSVVGQLLSTMMTGDVLSRSQAPEFLNKLADTISSSVDEPASGLHALVRGLTETVVCATPLVLALPTRVYIPHFDSVECHALDPKPEVVAAPI